MNPAPAKGATAGHSETSRALASVPPREHAALLILARVGRLATGRYAELVESAGSACAVLERERLMATAQTSFFTDPEQELQKDLNQAERELANWRAQGMRFVSVLDAAYPANLRAAHDRPPFVFIAGQMKPRDDRAVAVIGSRDASRPGLRAAAAVAQHLVEHRYTVLSGLAAGIDTAAHTAALKRGGRTIAVIGTGLARCYPRANVILQRRIAAECAVVSQFQPDTPPSQDTFPLRNAVMSGLSLATVIVEAGPTSGTRIQARQSLAQGRPVFLPEPMLRERWARELAELSPVYVVASLDEITAALERLSSAEPLVA
jgi:DNA processing protein